MKKQGFSSKFGTLMVLAGSAVGLGNLWKFPYTLGNNGGAAFLVIYILFVILLGVPLMVAELSIGRLMQKNAIDAFGGSRFKVFGILGVITVNLILCFYSTIGGWAIAYIYYYATNTFAGFNSLDVQTFYMNLISNPLEPVFWQFLFMLLTGFCLTGGVQKGLERSSKIMMPILFFSLIFLAIRSLALPGALPGLTFMFKPDFSKINFGIVLSAMAQAFFSLSLGMAIMITFGGYLAKKENLLRLAGKVAISDTIVAVMTGIIIFPAVFAFGLQVDSGPALLFITLPNVFNAIPFGSFFGTVFFLLVFFAALTSSISMLETSVSYFTNNKNYNRRTTVIVLSSLIFLLGIPMTLSAGPLADITIIGQSIFNFFAIITDKIMIVLTALGSVIYAGWGMKKDFQKEVLNGGTIKLTFLHKVLFFLIRFIVPCLVGIILIQGCIALLPK